MNQSDAQFMAKAIELSRLGFPAPNPRVGAVVVSNGETVGRGYHHAIGMQHGEAAAIEEAGDRSQGADLYVTLEPCNHHGRTPPCTDAILAAGIRRVVFANRDPNPGASGGAERLREAGVIVESGVLAEEAREVNRIFEGSWRLGRPYVVAKAAITLDGFLADIDGESKWITAEVARRRGHELRAELGCVLIGAETALRDRPSLSAHEVEGRVQLRVVLDPRRRLPDDLGLFITDDILTLRVVGDNAQPPDTQVTESDGVLDLRQVLAAIAARGMIGVLVEGGGRTIGEFFKQGLVDEIELHVAPKALGGGTNWLQAPRALSEAWQFEDVAIQPLGDGFRINAKVKR
ncbi:MAG: bifunctional diaminohydroxyphosphoribosylaminopyrimidine deaminase/5-amino-6-(5-phosphoribosylamino)uracil reductase RibD [Armatimonadota bacterium]|nr:bifunctional diaminohydroxyphosphoribosylaminopyrimidine deaminase/5-amino-6-(5-phosphoribosylamino)uracil reductase RibD [Armatimonadota bacterium]